MHPFQGDTADEVWRQAFAAVTGAGGAQDSRQQSSRVGATHELPQVAMEVADPRQRWVTSRLPHLNPALGVAEVVWILAGSNDSQPINYFFPGMPKFAGDGPTYYGAYGERLRSRLGFDQVARACEALAGNPHSRQVVLQIWDGRSDLPQDAGQPRAPDIPCNIVSLLKVREGRLEWTQIMRSNDIHRGLPHNFLQFTFLQEVMAGWLGVELGAYHHWSDSLHLYHNDEEEAGCTDAPRARAENTDRLVTDASEGERVIAEMYRRMVALTADGLGEEDLAAVLLAPGLPQGYQNLLRVLGAESARRRKRPEQAAAIMADCTNPQLRDVWTTKWRL